MCGIAGLMTARRDGPDPTVLARMADALAHRGPDGRKHYLVGNVGLAHNRLAIIDLETGDQPLYEPGGAALVANGEIYNYLELRQELHGVNFATNSDCEPALWLYRRHGLAFVEKLRGMYAIALHDPKAGRLVLARDPFGIKPLYYVESEHGLAFASEPQALIAAGLAARAIDSGPQAELLELQFTTRRDTIFPGIERVLPGETIVVADGKIVERHRRAALPAEGPDERDEAAALEQLEKALLDSVEVHQRADVPYGMFLSGGIDSSALLALMARLNARPVVALTAHFPGSQAPDERLAAQAVAKSVGARHIEVEVTAQDFWSLLPRVAAAMDDPAADYACVPTFKLAARAKEEGLKVVLSGEGGDELFGGYGRYRSVMRPWWMGGRAMRRKGIFDGLGVLRQRTVGWRDGIAAAEATERINGRSRLQVAQAMDCADWLPNDLLAKLDRCLMAHGVEGRTPFLDPAVASIAFRLPDRLKVRDRKGKWLLRRWLDAALPEAGAFAPKRGFTVPVAEWIHAEGAKLGPLVAAQPGIADVAEPAAVAKLFRDPRKHAGFAAWTLLFYALWHRRHIEGKPPDGDVFACLTR
ncbi:MAG TPA: asparagine synthase (glutamine-hydrolyzing) [Alphaproteobacteria bacterium]|nr:asparagine synthase (glutamine-hydrolyzing) [Alphaproteobacteria bacterium]